MRPLLVVLGGPNGAGKSTAAEQLLPEGLGISTFLNADLVAQGLSAYAPEEVAVEAGRFLLLRFDELLERRAAFAIESTLSGRALARRLCLARQDGYEVEVVYLWLSSVALSKARVEQRVARGGHDIPDEVLTRRYPRSIRNFLEVYRGLADQWKVYDNSEVIARLVATGGARQETRVIEERTWRRVLAAGGL